MTEHFTKQELSCNCGCGAYIDDYVFLHYLEIVRTRFGKPMVLSSAKRCARYNSIVSSTGHNGPHVKHSAVDVLVYGTDFYELLWMSIAYGFTGVGVNQKGPHNQRFLHLDRREKPYGWSY